MRIPRVSISLYLKQLFFNACKQFKAKMPLLYGTILLGFLFTIFGALLLIQFPISHNPVIKNTILGLILDHGEFWLFLGFFFLSISAIAIVGSYVEVRPSDKVLKKLYLNYLRQNVERYVLNGNPVGRNYHGIGLDEAYFPLQFVDNLPLTDYPLTETELQYYRSRQIEKKSTQDEDRLLYAAKYIDRESRESSYGWEHQINTNYPISFADIQKEMETVKENSGIITPVVIEGFPCSGKSTLITWLLLCAIYHGLRRYRRKNRQKFWEYRLKLALIPIYINLGEYVRAFLNTPNLSLLDFLKQTLQIIEVENVVEYLQRCLQSGHCIVLLDGLDEIELLDEKLQEEIKASVNTFVSFCCLFQEGYHFNRVIITSRVATYNYLFRSALRNSYLHYIIMELTSEQIKSFCFRWFAASIHDAMLRRTTPPHNKRVIMDEAQRQTDDFYQQIINWEGIREIIKNPSGLVWLLLLSDQGFDFPHQRAILYQKITTAMLESRKGVNGQPLIPEEIVLQRLGPLAFKMQLNQTNFISQDQVMEVIKQAIETESSINIQSIDDEAKTFFKHVHLTCGILARRAGTFYGFIYPPLQQYICARYICLVGAKGSEQEFENLIAELFQSNTNWQEVLLLAVTYENEEAKSVTKRIIKAVLSPTINHGLEESACLFAGLCLIHNFFLLGDPDLEKLAAMQLFHVYEEGQRQNDKEICNQITKILYLWSVGLLENGGHSCPIWSISQECSNEGTNSSHLQTCISLLKELIKLPEFRSLDVIKPLIPLPMSLVGISTAGNYQSDTNLKVTSNQIVKDEALSLLVYIDQKLNDTQFSEALRRHIEVQSTSSSTSQI